jgi:hypothetical protein
MINVTFGAEPRHAELERLVCAAVSNPRFARQLLASPELAVERSEYARRLSAAERALVASIAGAQDIHEFAARLHARVKQAH